MKPLHVLCLMLILSTVEGYPDLSWERDGPKGGEYRAKGEAIEEADEQVTEEEVDDEDKEEASDGEEEKDDYEEFDDEDEVELLERSEGEEDVEQGDEEEGYEEFDDEDKVELLERSEEDEDVEEEDYEEFDDENEVERSDEVGNVEEGDEEEDYEELYDEDEVEGSEGHAKRARLRSHFQNGARSGSSCKLNNAFQQYKQIILVIVFFNYLFVFCLLFHAFYIMAWPRTGNSIFDTDEHLCHESKIVDEVRKNVEFWKSSGAKKKGLETRKEEHGSEEDGKIVKTRITIDLLDTLQVKEKFSKKGMVPPFDENVNVATETLVKI
ncbi:uncharacterized protein LOC144917629 [Branchiostoma floridae x Branchiostoma belcheri]